MFHALPLQDILLGDDKSPARPQEARTPPLMCLLPCQSPASGICRSMGMIQDGQILSACLVQKVVIISSSDDEDEALPSAPPSAKRRRKMSFADEVTG